jgi:hypothetical protein
MKKRWRSHEDEYIWVWDRTIVDRMLSNKLDADKELVKWCLENDCGVASYWVECNDEQTFLLFALRWT